MIRSARFAKSRKARVRARALELADSIEFQFRATFNLTRHDPRYLRSTIEEMAEDLQALAFLKDPKSRETVVDDDIDEETIDRLMNDEGAWEEVMKFRPGAPG